MPNQQPNLEEQFTKIAQNNGLAPKRIFVAAKIGVFAFTIILLNWLFFTASLIFLPIGFVLIAGAFLLFNALIKRIKFRLTRVNKEKVFGYHFKNFLIGFCIFLFIIALLIGRLFFQCLCIWEVRNIFTGECETFTGSFPWYYKEDSSCGKQNATADWQVYRNEEYGFEFKFPQDWIIDPIVTDISVGNIFQIYKIDKGQEKMKFLGDFEEVRYVVRIYVGNIEDEKFYEKLKVLPGQWTVGEYDAQRYEFPSGYGPNIVTIVTVPNKNRLYQITYTALAPDVTYYKFMDAYEQIINNIRFIEAGE